MEYSSFIGLANNCAWLLTLVLVYDLLDVRRRRATPGLQRVVSGIVLGGIAIAVIVNPLDFGHGVVFDTRSVLLCIVGFFFGTVPVAIAALMSVIFRWYLGGAGTFVGVAVILTSGGIGLAWRHLRVRTGKPPTVVELYLLGIVVHVAMLAWMFALPWPIALEVLAGIALPVLLIHPLATTVLGKMMVLREERKHSETLLSLSEDKFRSLFADHAAVKMLIDPETGAIIEANKAAARFYGWSEEELKAKFIHELDIMSPEEIRAEIARARAKEKQYFEFRHRLADGSIKDVGVYSSAVVVNGRELLHSIVHDISDHKRAEQALLESEERFRSIVESAPDPIFVQTDMRFSFCNSKAVTLFGATNENELLGTPVMERFHPDYHDEMLKRIQTLNHERKPMERLFEQPFVRLDGSLIWVETSGQPLRFNGQDSALVFARDISERKKIQLEQEKLQQQLLQAQKMESVGRLAGGVAHDYNNMLSVIIGYTEFALEQIPAEHNAHQDLTEVLSAARRSADITKQLLAFARRQTITPIVLDLNEAVSAMLKMLRRLIGENIELAWLPAKDLWPVRIDQTQVDQILANLCVNARDSIEDVGKVTMETAMVSLDQEYCDDHLGFVPGDFVVLAVSDTGCGMDRAILQHVFEPFFTTKSQGKGTGLGLATVYGIVKQNNGFINVYSEPDKGTTIKIYLPCHAGEVVQSDTGTKGVSVIGNGEVILVVEDEVSILQIAKKMLGSLGYRVLTASTPNQAISMVEQFEEAIDLLVTDVIMPEMNGKELESRLQEICPQLKTLFMSGYTANVIAHKGVLKPGVCFMAKPFSKQDIAEKVRLALGNSAANVRGGKTEILAKDPPPLSSQR